MGEAYVWTKHDLMWLLTVLPTLNIVFAGDSTSLTYVTITKKAKLPLVTTWLQNALGYE
jgi:hypothetical protein